MRKRDLFLFYALYTPYTNTTVKIANTNPQIIITFFFITDLLRLTTHPGNNIINHPLTNAIQPRRVINKVQSNVHTLYEKIIAAPITRFISPPKYNNNEFFHKSFAMSLYQPGLIRRLRARNQNTGKTICAMVMAVFIQTKLRIKQYTNSRYSFLCILQEMKA